MHGTRAASFGDFHLRILSAPGWANLVFPSPGLWKRENLSRPFQAKSPDCSHCAQTVWATLGEGEERMEAAKPCWAECAPGSSWRAVCCKSSADLQGSLGLIYAFMVVQKMLSQLEN